MDTPRWPTPPSLDTSRIHRPNEHPAVGLHRGWCAARNGEPRHDFESPAFLAGWDLWQQVKTDAHVKALRLALMDMQPDERPMPRVYPRLP